MQKLVRQLIIMLIVSLPLNQAVCAEYLFGIVPQQSSTKLARHWIPIANYIHRQSDIKIKFSTAPTITQFEKRIDEGLYDIAYYPRVPIRDMESIKAALFKMQESKEGRKLLSNIKINGFESAQDQDWNDIRKLKLKVNN